MGVKKKMNTIRWQPCQKKPKKRAAEESINGEKTAKIIFFKKKLKLKFLSPSSKNPRNFPTFDGLLNYSKNVNMHSSL